MFQLIAVVDLLSCCGLTVALALGLRHAPQPSFEHAWTCWDTAISCDSGLPFGGGACSELLSPFMQLVLDMGLSKASFLLRKSYLRSCKASRRSCPLCRSPGVCSVRALAGGSGWQPTAFVFLPGQHLPFGLVALPQRADAVRQ